MAIVKRKFNGRAPRYNLKPFHEKVIIYSNANLGKNESTDFLNISSTGLAFVATEGSLPDFGSIINITFSVPEEESLTVRAQVVRLKNYTRPHWYKRYHDEKGDVIKEFVIGVHFLNIKREQQQKLSSHLDRLIATEKLERKKQKITFLKDSLKKSYVWIIISLLGVFFTALSLKFYFE